MRTDMEVGRYYVIEPQDQPEGSKVLFLTVGGQVMTFQADGVRYRVSDGEGFTGYSAGLEGYLGDKVVVEFEDRQPWALVDKSHLELRTGAQLMQLATASLAGSVQAG